MGNINEKKETLRSKLWKVPIALAVATVAVMANPVTNNGTPAKPHSEEYENITLSAQKLGWKYNIFYWRSNSPTQPQIDHYMPVLKEEIDKLPEGLLERCVDGINLTGDRIEHLFMPKAGSYDSSSNKINMSLPNHISKEGEQYIRETFWHELHHGCDYNLSAPQEHAAYEALRERRPSGDIIGYAREYGKTKRAEDEATLLELLAVNYDEYINRIAEDPILKAKGMELERRYNNWTDGEMDKNYWNSIAIDRLGQLK